MQYFYPGTTGGDPRATLFPVVIMQSLSVSLSPIVI
jgi:hypothetical protein